MKLATWNINSLNVRLPHVLDWVGKHRPDVLCLQETKLEDPKFPADALREAGYETLAHGQKTYNGVAILSRLPMTDAQSGIPGFEDDQKRVLSATISGVRIVCAYVPNGENLTSPKFQYKMKWMEAFRLWLKDELARHPHLAVVGDYNVAPEAQDVHDPALWENKIHFTEPERKALHALFDLGLVDAFRLFEQPERSYTWWDYRMMAFRRKMGLRIDHVLLSPQLAKRCTACTIDIEPRRLERPSDHAPVIADLNL
ncbi:MAG TPA: exodeoxyribonuclease III [Burkholderiales bacterium]|nr:exodeoxyribonuclease III [Burkholderiales bacterium]